MKKIQYKELKNIKEFNKDKNGLVWSPFNIDEFMGFTIYRIRATEGLNGEAILKYTEEYVMSGHNKEKECKDEEYLNQMKKDLKRILNYI
ncbi:hypothetical protein EXM90_19100 [Clostridium botulinum]|uniref:hypothetical protein n=1 Tax=Clostridium botulinum TaxID=1491 RepID=UPI0004652DCF|nr:hypothetical protein [Clostridium botulinum]APR02508.1 hypothetical protein RSJ2_3951 [Clostridium botulinum]MBN3367027.1 hypothetical protein [Clostridium botulinum]MBN3371663.1 hypothetical protein [Clostridium botulinum]MBN3375531.1 hypothetical protein [Clostridium botulinum]MBN3384188.1 hypothetical protein [Clostridium botulinum]